jgi:hypothetical protein
LRVHRLVELAELYEVPATLLVPPQHERNDTDGIPPLVIDLRRLRKLPPTRTGPLRRWIAIVQVLRSENSRDVLRLRSSDLRSLAKLYSTTPAVLYERLGAWGALVPVEAQTQQAQAHQGHPGHQGRQRQRQPQAQAQNGRGSGTRGRGRGAATHRPEGRS